MAPTVLSPLSPSIGHFPYSKLGLENAMTLTQHRAPQQPPQQTNSLNIYAQSSWYYLPIEQTHNENNYVVSINLFVSL